MFPTFELYSTPLALLIVQGFIFSVLLIIRYLRARKPSDLLLALLLMLMIYHRIGYTLGFMGWYDTYTNTKINYYLFSLGLVFGPLLFLYTRTLLVSPFRLQKADLWHFVPATVYLIYRMGLLVYDSQQPDWDQGYDGIALREVHLSLIGPLHRLLEYSALLLYLAFTIQLFVKHRNRIRQFFSSTYKVELNWIKVFLIIFSILFMYETITDLVDALIPELRYKNKWWVHFINAIALIFLGIKGYFTDLSELAKLPDGSGSGAGKPNRDLTKSRQRIEDYLQEGHFKKPDLTLGDLARGLGVSQHEASAMLNSSFEMNFNELINRYRVDDLKLQLKDTKKDHYSLIALAYESGFNSKASFNRIFKKIEGVTPSEYKKNQHT